LLSGVYGRLRDVLVAPNGDIYLCTSNRDGRGSAADGDDRIIRLTPKR
jgi:glucose/arabinose dehydrogenase